MTKQPTIAGQHSKELLHYLLHRRSVSRKDLSQPGPTQPEISQILKAASRVSDHGKLFPFWFIVFQEKDKDDFVQKIADVIHQDHPKEGEDKALKKAEKLMDAPVVIAVVSSVRECKIPAWEQFLTAGAVCQNLMLSANALGYGVNWLTEWLAYDARIHNILHLEDHDNICGFFYIGTAQDVPDDRDRPDMDAITTYWSAEQTVLNKGDDFLKEKTKPGKGRLGFHLPKDFI